MKRSVRESIRRANDRWGRRLTSNYSENKMFWKEVKQQKKGGRREEMVKDRNGQLLTKEEEVNRRWAEHIEELLIFNDETEAKVIPVAFGEGAPRMDRNNKTSVTKKEVERALRGIRLGKVAGRHGIPAKCLNPLVPGVLSGGHTGSVKISGLVLYRQHGEMHFSIRSSMLKKRSLLSWTFRSPHESLWRSYYEEHS